MLEGKNISVVEDNTEVKVNFVLPGFMRSCQEYRQIGSFTDVAIHCLHPDSGDVTIYSAHSLLLSASSTCFSYILEKALSQLSQLHIHSLKKQLQVIQNNEPYEAYFLSKEENVLTFEIPPRCFKEDAAKDGEDDLFSCSSFNSEVTDDTAKPSLSPVNGIGESSDSKKPIVVTLTSFNTLNNVILVLKGLDPMYFKYVLYCVYSQSFSIKKENINFFLCIIHSFKLTNCRNLANLLQCFISDEGKGIPNETLSMSYKLDTTENKTAESPPAFKPFLKDHETFSVLNAEFDTIQRKSIFIPSLSSSLMPLDLSIKHGDLIKSNGSTSNGMEIVDNSSTASNVWSPPTKGSSHIEILSLACQSSNVLKKIDSNVVYNTLYKSLSYPYMSSLFGENGSACEETSEVEKSEHSEENLSLDRSELSTLIKCKEVILERPLNGYDARKRCPEDASSRSNQNVIMHEKKRSADSTCQRVLSHTKESVNAKKIKYSHKQSVTSKCDSPHIRYAAPSFNASDGIEKRANHAHNGLNHLPSVQDDSLLKLKNNSSIRIQRLPQLTVPKKMKSNKRNHELELEFTKVFPSDRSKKTKYEGDAELSKMCSVKTESTDSNGGQSCLIVCERKPQRRDHNKLVYTCSATEEDVWKGKRNERNADENIYGEILETNEETSDGESDGSINLETGKTNNNETDISNGAEMDLTIIKTNKPINEETSKGNQETNKTTLKTSKTNEEREKVVDEETDSMNIETGKETETIKCYACEFDAPKFSDVICHIKEHHLTRDLKMSHCIDPKCPVQLLFCSNEWEKHIEHHIIKFSYECTECTYSTKTSIGIMRHEMTHRTTRKRILLPIKKVGPKGRPPSAAGKRKPPFRTQPTPCRKTGKAGKKKNKKKAQPAKRVPKKRRMRAKAPPGQDELKLEDVCRSRLLVGLVKGICLKEQRGHAGFKNCFAVLTSSHFFEAGFGSEDEPRQGPSDSDKNGGGGGAMEGQPLEQVALPPPPNNDAATPSCSQVPFSTTQKILTRKVRFTSKKKKRKLFNCKLCDTVLSSKDSLATHYHHFHRFLLPFTCPFDGCNERLDDASHLYMHVRTHPKSSSSPLSGASSCLEAASPVRRDLDHQEKLTDPELKFVYPEEKALD